MGGFCEGSGRARNTGDVSPTVVVMCAEVGECLNTSDCGVFSPRGIVFDPVGVNTTTLGASCSLASTISQYYKRPRSECALTFRAYQLLPHWVNLVAASVLLLFGTRDTRLVAIESLY